MLDPREVLDTLRMIDLEKLDVRTITLGISLLGCVSDDADRLAARIYDTITKKAERLVAVGEEIEREYGVPIVNKRISVTPVALIAGAIPNPTIIARALDRAAKATGVHFIGGYAALAQKGMTAADRALIASLPEALSETERVCAAVNVASTRAGIDMDAIALCGRAIKELSIRTADQDGFGCAKLVVFANAVEDNPFMAGAFHGPGEGDWAVNVGVSGPGVVKRALEEVRGAPCDEVAEQIKRTAFRVTRVGQMVAREAARRLGAPFGIVDLSLAPTPAQGDSVARILEEIGLEVCGGPGSTAALALLNDAVKKGGVMASSHVGGLSGAFIPLSEDIGMIEAAERGALCLEKLEALTCVCSVGLDMIALPGDITADTLCAILADEAAIGVVNNKTTGARLIPVPGKSAGDTVEFGGLFGRAPILPVKMYSAERFIARGGRIPAPLTGLRN
ncbi:MAG: PFL family protein [Oscillospiraceae bacterium]|nr:PFL family protein [Oscillospiraceae bacterium]